MKKSIVIYLIVVLFIAVSLFVGCPELLETSGDDDGSGVSGPAVILENALGVWSGSWVDKKWSATGAFDMLLDVTWDNRLLPGAGYRGDITVDVYYAAPEGGEVNIYLDGTIDNGNFTFDFSSDTVVATGTITGGKTIQGDATSGYGPFQFSGDISATKAKINFSGFSSGGYGTASVSKQ